MMVHNQPQDGTLGEAIQAELSSMKYGEMYIFSAFAKNSGVLRLKKALEEHKKNGGKIKAYIGVDLNGTSYEALLNLYAICDNLYIIHSENPQTTYHRKIYLLRNADHAWLAIGSNNLTGGGLWTNYETSSIQEIDLPSTELAPIEELITNYESPENECSLEIKSISQIDELLRRNYITTESQHRKTLIDSRASITKRKKKNRLFGSEPVHIPAINKKTKSPKNTLPKSATVSSQTAKLVSVSETLSFWTESGSVTGGSSNQIDLSKRGRIAKGFSAKDTILDSNDRNIMLGGIRYFDINPDDTSAKKEITINYNGIDYVGNTISYRDGNSNWRLLLNGHSASTPPEKLSKLGKKGEFKNKILVFEKISSEYYSLSVLPQRSLGKIQTISAVWGTNGKNKLGRKFGIY